MKKAVPVLLLFFCTSAVFAGGFQVNLQGQKQTGMGHAGSGLLLDASSILFNPGGVCFLDSMQRFSLGGNLIIPRTQYLEPAPGIYTAEIMSRLGTPFSFYTAFNRKAEDRWKLGLGVYTPFGSTVQWPDDWKGQFLIRQIDLKTVFIQPTVSYQLTEKLGMGVGFVFATGGFALRKAVPLQDSSGTYGEGRLDGNAFGSGVNLGLFFKVNEKFSIGLDYRSAVRVGISNGTAEFTVPSALKDSFPETFFSSQIILPRYATLGFGFCPAPKWKIALDINYAAWSSYDTLNIDFKKNTTTLQDIHSPRNYKDVFIYRLGLEYQLTSAVTLRAGGYFDTSPVPDGYLTPETPDADKIGISTGATIKASKRIRVDLSLLYIEGKQRSDTNLETQFSGTWKSKAVAPGLGIELVF